MSASVRNFTVLLREAGMGASEGRGGAIDPVVVRPLSYVDQWKYILKNDLYTLLLDDHSIFVEIEGTTPSYIYMQCPLAVLTKKDFARAQGVVGRDVYSAELADNYSQYLDSADLRSHVMYFRYDVDRACYRDDCHPAGHLHCGFESEVRIATEREWTFFAFGAFIVRQCYPESWRIYLTRPSAASLVKRVRTGLSLFPPPYSNILVRESFFA